MSQESIEAAKQWFYLHHFKAMKVNYVRIDFVKLVCEYFINRVLTYPEFDQVLVDCGFTISDREKCNVNMKQIVHELPPHLIIYTLCL